MNNEGKTALDPACKEPDASTLFGEDEETDMEHYRMYVARMAVNDLRDVRWHIDECRFPPAPI
jgi:hypothetical protein